MNENESKKRVRSSPYPYYDLGKCIELVKMLYEKARLFESPIEEGIKAMDLSPDSSTGFRAIAALTMFGLIEQRREGETRFVKISELGKDIILSSYQQDNKGDLDLIKKAALKPDIIKHFWHKYANKELPSDRVLELNMLHDSEFIISKTALSTVVSVFKDTLKFAELKSGSNEPAQNNNDTNKKDDVTPEESTVNRKPSEVKDELDSHKPAKLSLEHFYPLGKDRAFKLSFPDDAGNHELQLLKNWVNFVIESEVLRRKAE